MSNKTLSIVITCFNEGKLIIESVGSAIGQTVESKEIIVVDDGSDKRTKQAIEQLPGSVKVITLETNSGVSAARNIGSKAATGKYILFHDGDDYLDPEYCELAINVLENNKMVEIVSCKVQLIINRKAAHIYTPKGGSLNNFLFSMSSISPSLLRKRTFDMVGLYDENMKEGLEDWELFIRILNNSGGYCHVINQVGYYYRKRSDSITFRYWQCRHNSRAYIFHKHKEIYKNNFPELLKYFTNEVNQLERKIDKIYSGYNYRAGYYFLKIPRILKRFLIDIIKK